MVNSPKNWQGRVICALVFLGVVCPASAQEPESRFELFGQFGGSFFTEKSARGGAFVLDPVFVFVGIPTRKTTSLTKTGRLFVGVRYYFTAQDAVEVSYSYSPSDLRERQDLINQTFGSNIRASFVSLNYVRYLMRHDRWQLFVTGGLGFVHLDGFASPDNDKFTTNFGGGMDIVLNRVLTFRFEYRDFLMDRPTILFASPGGVVHNHVPSAGVVFKF